MSKKLIQLTNPEVVVVIIAGVPKEVTITHYQVCNITVEIPRLNQEKIGYISLWISKGYIENNMFIAPPISGINALLINENYDYVWNTIIVNDLLITELQSVISQQLINNGKVIGTIIDDPTT